MKYILNVIEDKFIDGRKAKCSARDLLGRARQVVEAVKRKDDDLFIVIHNIDGPGLRCVARWMSASDILVSENRILL